MKTEEQIKKEQDSTMLSATSDIIADFTKVVKEEFTSSQMTGSQKEALVKFLNAVNSAYDTFSEEYLPSEPIGISDLVIEKDDSDDEEEDG